MQNLTQQQKNNGNTMENKCCRSYKVNGKNSNYKIFAKKTT